MKHGKRPTVRQAIFIEENICLDPRDWLVAKDTGTEMLLVNRSDKHTTVKIAKTLKMIKERGNEDG